MSADDDIHRGAKFLPQAREVHAKYPLFDGHNDLPWAIRGGFDMKLSNVDLSIDNTDLVVEGIPWRGLHTDIPRLRKGGVGAQFWSVFVPCSLTGSEAVQATLEQIDLVHQLCDKYPKDIAMAETAADVMRLFKEGKIASICGIEGGHQIGGSLRALRMFFKLGARYMTLTHNGGPGWADAAVNLDGSFAHEAPLGGLTDFGRDVVYEMNRIGMIVDISHVHEKTMHVALDCSKAPVMFSHSSTRALCAHPRDVPDDVLIKLKANNGIVMVVFLSKFVAGEFWVRGGKVGATLIEVADHIDHVVKIAGIDHVGIGGDYDGGNQFARGLEDVSTYPDLTAELLFRRYSEEDLGKLLGLNAIRVLQDCEDVAKKMQAEGALACESHFSEELYETNIVKEKKLLKA
jgi:membrane dipeptidase